MKATRLARLEQRYRDKVTVLKEAGFVFERTAKGSHVTYILPSNGARVTVHGGGDAYGDRGRQNFLKQVERAIDLPPKAND